MQGKAILSTVSVVCTGVLLAACGDQATSPTTLREAEAAPAASPHAAQLAIANLATALEPFTVRARLDPYFINQAPDLMMRSHVASDLAIQRLVTPPGVGGWHTHPGPSFAIVEEGQVMITRYTRKGCVDEVYGKGDTYFEVAGEVHRATVLGPDDAVEYKVRFNTPFGEPFANPAPDPGC